MAVFSLSLPSLSLLFFYTCAGATLGKGFNRMLATFVAGGLGVGAHCLATLAGRKGEPILIATFVFIIGKITYTSYKLLRLYIHGVHFSI